jgi:hypothetical protein
MNAIITPPDTTSVAFETNGRGWLGYVAELPGAFVRGATEEEALSKVDGEVRSYLAWLGTCPKPGCKAIVVQRHRSTLAVEDADNEILLAADGGPVGGEDFRHILDVARLSGDTFLKLYGGAEFKEWIDEARLRKTFYGENPASIQMIFDHVKNCQYYYLSRTGISFDDGETDFARIREMCLDRITGLYDGRNNSETFRVDGESWTLKKILRRFVWHDRIHGKAIVRILEKQSRLGVIGGYEDPFHFFAGAPFCGK